MKAYPDKCNTLSCLHISMRKYLRIITQKNTHSPKLLQIVSHGKRNFNKNISNLCNKGNVSTSVLGQIFCYLFPDQRKTMM